MSQIKTTARLLDPVILKQAILASFAKLDPRIQLRNPVMFAVYLGSILTTILWVNSLFGTGDESSIFVLEVATWLWFTVLFANFAEAIAEGQGKAQAASLKKARTTVTARRIADMSDRLGEEVSATDLNMDDIVIVKAGETVPADGEVIEGVASVDESAITGESAPVVRESGGDRSAVTGGTRVISDWLIIRVTTLPGSSFLDRMISMVEGARRQKTPNEIALAILLAALTLIFLLVVATLLPYSIFSVEVSGQGRPISLTVLVALFVCLAPTTIGALLSAIGIAGMNRLSQANVIAMSGRAVEAAGDVDVLLLDKTGTITLGNRQATRFIPAEGVNENDLAEVAHLASMADETAEGRSIAVLAKKQFGLRGRELEHIKAHFVPFSARTRMSGVSIDGQEIRKGATEAVEEYVRSLGGSVKVYIPEQVQRAIQRFFQKPNLTALRELSLRQAARRIHTDVETARREKADMQPWATNERLLVCVGPSPTTARVIRTAKRMAAALDAPWLAVSVDRMGEAEDERVNQQVAHHFRLAERLGAETVTLAGQRTATTILDYARSRNVTKILIGKTAQSRWKRLLFGTVVDEVLENSGDIDVYVIHGKRDDAQSATSKVTSAHVRRKPYILSSLIVAITGLLAATSRTLHLADSEANTVMLFLAAVAIVAHRFGRGPATWASMLAVMVFDFFFVPPFYTLTVADVRYVVTFGVMLAIGLAISTLTSRLKSMVERSRLREQRTAAQYELGKLLTSLYGNVFLASAAGEKIAEMIGGEVAIAGASSSLLESNTLDDETRRQLLETVADEAARLNRLLENILQMSKLDAGVSTPNRQWHVLEEIVGSALHRTHRELEKNKVQVNLPTDLPLVFVDGLFLEQVLVNLLENAVRHNPQQAQIAITATVDSKSLKLMVTASPPSKNDASQHQIRATVNASP